MSNDQVQAGNHVQIGDHAPDFTLPTQAGSTVSLKDFLGKSIVVLYFYPKDNTGGCTKEACSFRDSYEVFKEAGAEVIGVSSDSVASHDKFAQKYRLPFILASDTGGKLRKRYGVPTALGILPGRVTYIIDKQGIVRHISVSHFAPEKHITEALNILKELATQ
ncbi:MAG TPA: peroxiredoxin [Ktedonobacteraceae bacterium]|jgi:peroxiredoxin Q/BCP